MLSDEAFEDFMTYIQTADLYRIVKKRVIRCEECDGCANRENLDCGCCKNCKNKTRFGGNGLRKRACVEKECEKPIYKRYTKF